MSGRSTVPERWRQPWMFVVPGLLAVLLHGMPGMAYGQLVYVGTYTDTGSEGIYAYRFDPTDGSMTALGLAAATDNPSFLTSDPAGRVLYAVNELDEFHGEPAGAVSVFAIDRASGRLHLRQQVSSLGAGPAHLSLDASGKYLLVANYGGGSVAVFPIEPDGRLAPHSAFVQNAGSSVDPERQTGPHAHFIQVTPDDRFAITADLGLDKLIVHRFDPVTGSLTPATPAFAAVEPGAGPRHVAFDPSGKHAYVVNELTSTVTAFAIKTASGRLDRTQTISTLPPTFDGRNWTAEISVGAQGRFLYVSNRGHDSIAVFGIDPETGRLEALEWVASGGTTPRHFAIDQTGRWLFAANQTSNSVNLLRVDPQTGRLTPTNESLTVVAPVCVHVVSLPSE